MACGEGFGGGVLVKGALCEGVLFPVGVVLVVRAVAVVGSFPSLLGGGVLGMLGNEILEICGKIGLIIFRAAPD